MELFSINFPAPADCCPFVGPQTSMPFHMAVESQTVFTVKTQLLAVNFAPRSMVSFASGANSNRKLLAVMFAPLLMMSSSRTVMVSELLQGLTLVVQF